MGKSRIIIADLDKNYIVPLQQKFIEEFFEKIELEIITEEKYFNELFSKPQKAEVLIVSNDLYDSSLQKHNISNVFVMTEQYEEEQTDELNINKLFKYTSIKEIFNEIIGKSAIEGIDAQSKKEPQVILTYSACGGVGKTTVAIGISACLTKNYKRVLYINADRLQVFSHMIKNSTPIFENKTYDKLAYQDNNSYQHIKHFIRKEFFNYLPPFKSALMSIGLNYSIFEKIAICAKNSNDFDYIIIDSDKAFDESKANLINLADKVIIVLDQTINSVTATNTLTENINGSNNEKYIYICNKFDDNCESALYSPKVNMKFSVTDYINEIKYYDQLDVQTVSNDTGIQKVAMLVM